MRRAVPMGLAAVLVGACDPAPRPVPIDRAAHEAEVAAFAATREAELEAPDSWLSLIGLHWLEQGETTLGAAPDNDIVLPEGKAAPRVGRLRVEGTAVRFVAEPGVRVIQGVDSTIALSAGTGAIPPDTTADPEVAEADLSASPGPGKYVVLRHGPVNWIVIRRGDRVALRLRDNENEVYRAFQGIERYPTSLDWRVTARWVPHDKTVAVPDVLGEVSEEPSPAALEFWIDGERHTLDVTGDPDAARHMLVFADETSGRETYGGGRYLWVDRPDERGRVVIDFNKAYNPPCVWTPFATCPLPSRDNRLALAVEAGEKDWAH
ncbi:MAG TPA: DUF1684 domain-containing protein [Longimicrobiales bacterium]|nr:DUF1684 domain-containing protein [Longimicrobiales bacterium]